MNQVRVAITGAQGSGKTTLIDHLYDYWYGRIGDTCKKLVGLGESVRAQGLPMGERATTETLLIFAAAHVRRERESYGQLILQDRCLLDLLAYAHILGDVGASALALLEEIALSSFASIDLFIFLPFREDFEVDQYKRESEDFRKETSRRIIEVASRYRVPLTHLDGTPKERLASACALIEKRCGDRLDA